MTLTPLKGLKPLAPTAAKKAPDKFKASLIPSKVLDMACPSVMVDLETWGRTPGSALRSIGAAIFDPVSGKVGPTFYTVVSGCEMFGLTRDPETEAWWAEQGPEASEALKGYCPLDDALASFVIWWKLHAPEKVPFWTKGPHFDEAILHEALRAVGKTAPWEFYMVRDVRTVLDLARWPRVEFEGTPHHALDDALHQVKLVHASYKALGLSGE